MASRSAGTVAAIWRYPVKSLRGERLQEGHLGEDGIDGDRLVHVRESNGRVVTARYRPNLLALQAVLGRDGEPLIEGQPWNSPAALAAVRKASTPDVELVRFAEPDRGQRFDVMPLTVFTDGAASAIGLDYRRFRPNILVAGIGGLGEREWIGSALRIGESLVGAWRARPRCVMTTYDPDTLEQDPSVLRRIVTDFGGQLALDCWVIEPGHVREGDAVTPVAMPERAIAPTSSAAR